MSPLDLESRVSSLVEEADRDGVLCWRYASLRRAGYAARDAARLARTRHVDLHAALDLPRRGCDHATAVRILL